MDIDKELIKLIEDSRKAYDNSIDVIDGLKFNQKNLDKRIVYYTNNKYLSGNIDSKGRRKPYKQIINDKVELESSRTDIDLSKIDLVSLKGNRIATLVLEQELIKYATQIPENEDDLSLNQTFKNLNEVYVRHGGVMAKKTESAKYLYIEPVNWLNATTNQKNIRDDFITENHELTILDLQKKKKVYDNIDEIIFKFESKERIPGDTISIIEAEGEVEKHLITGKEEDQEEFVLATVFYATLDNKKYILFKEEIKTSKIKSANRKKSSTPNRARGLGLTEEGFESQISVNEAAISQNIAANYSGMVLTKTNSARLHQELESGIESGSTFLVENDDTLETETIRASDLSYYDSLYNTWETNYQRVSVAYEAATGEDGKVKPFRSLALQATQTASTFDYRGENFNELIRSIMKEWVLPFLVKKIKKEHLLELEFTGFKGQILQSEISKFNVFKQYKKDVLSGKTWTPEKYSIESEKERVKQMVQPDKVLKIPNSYYDSLLDDIVVVIGDDIIDTKAQMNALYEIWQSKDPADPTRKTIFNRMVELSNAISPLEIESQFPETGDRGDVKQPAIKGEMEALLTKAQQ